MTTPDETRRRAMSVVRTLTKTQRQAIISGVHVHGLTRLALWRLGLIIDKPGLVNSTPTLRFTDIGLDVRACLQEQNDA